MSASLIGLIPLVLLGLVGTLCFVGCGLIYNYSGYTYGSAYENKVSADPDIVAFWPLNDVAPPDNMTIPTAADVATHPPPPLNGQYMDSFMLQVAGIVPLDLQSDNTTPSLCASFSGGRVQVGFNEQLNAAPFTLECWVQPTWPASDMNIHTVVATTNLDPAANSGYALFCDNKNFWSASIGLGQGNGFIETTPDPSSQPVVPGVNQAFYLALTFDGMALNLFVTPVGQPFNMTPYATAKVPMGQKFAPSSGPLPLFIGMGRPDMPPGQFPFIGKIEDVAFYKTPFGASDLMTHFNNGANPG